MLATHLAPVPPLEDDDVIVRSVRGVVAGLAPAMQDGTVDRYRLGLRNGEGRIYRHLDVECMRVVIAITKSLRGFGFAAEPGSLEPAAHGCQIVFSRPPTVRSIGVIPRGMPLWRDLPQWPARGPATVSAAVHGN